MLKRFCDTCDKEPVIPIVKQVQPTILDEFKKVYELTNDVNEYVKSSELVEWVKDKEVSMTKLGRDLNKYAKDNNFENIYSKVKKINGKPFNIWTGIKLRK